MKNKIRSFGFRVLSTVVMFSFAATAQAEQLLEEIVVTAQKREQIVTDIPMSVTALSGEDLKTLGLTDTRDLAMLVPGLSYSVSPQQTPVYTMRGIGFNTFNFTSTSPVGIYYDEFSSPYPYAAKGMAFDIDRLEVLKGPQGTLYGRNTTGGLVNYISNQPGEEFEAEITVGMGEFETVTAEGFVGGPLTDSLGVRAAFAWENSDEGWQKSRTRPDDELGKKDRYAVRLIADFHPNDAFQANLTVNHWKDQSEPTARQVVAAQDSIPGLTVGYFPWDRHTIFDFVVPDRDANVADWYHPSSASPGAGAWPAAFAPLPSGDNESDSTQVNLRLDWHLNPNLTLSSLTHSGTTDRADFFGQSGAPVEYGLTQSIGEIDTFSQELRLTGVAADERLNYIVGLYYSKDDLYEEDFYWSEATASLRGVRFGAAGAAAALAPLFGLDAAGTAALVAGAQGGFRTWGSFTEGESESRAVFGQFDYKISDQLELTLGARYTEDDLTGAGCSRDNRGDNNIQGAWNILFVTAVAGLGPDQWSQPGECISFLDVTNFSAGLVDPGGHAVELEEDSFSWRTALTWEPGDSAMFYASISKGFKSGVIPANSAFTAEQLMPVNQEEVMTYEVGTKASPTDWMQINASIYQYDYQDKQLFSYILDPVFNALRTLVNVPESEVRGGEVDVILYPSDNTVVKVGASYVDSEITKFIGVDASGNVQNYQGSSFQETPEWEFTFLLSHNFNLANDLSLRGTVDVSYRDEAKANLTAQGVPEPLFNKVHSYTLVGARLALTPAEDNWEVALFGRNLTNEYHALMTETLANEFANRLPGMVRTWGAEFTYRF